MISRWRKQVCSAEHFGERDFVDRNLKDNFAVLLACSTKTLAKGRAAYRARGHNRGLNTRFWHAPRAWPEHSPGERIATNAS